MVMMMQYHNIIADTHHKVIIESAKIDNSSFSSLTAPNATVPFRSPTRRGLQENSDLFFEDDAFEKEDEDEFVFETDPLMYTFLSTRCPVHLRQTVRGQSVVIDSLITTESNYLLHCVLVKQGDPTPSSLFLLSSLTQSPPWFVSSDLSLIHI